MRFNLIWILFRLVLFPPGIRFAIVPSISIGMLQTPETLPTAVICRTRLGLNKHLWADGNVNEEDPSLTISELGHGHHLGHYKRLFTVIDKSLEYEEKKEFKEVQERIAGCYVAILNNAIQHNYSYKRWK